MSEEIKDTITLEFDNNEEIECVELGVFDVDGVDYMALMPVSQENEEEAEVLLYRYNEVGEDEFELADLESDEEFEKVAAVFDAIMEEEEEE